MLSTPSLLAALALGASSSASAQIVFANFNSTSAPFATLTNASGTSVGINHANSSIARVETGEPLEGSGHQRLILDTTGQTALLRLRHLSGGGAPANNTSFTTSAGVDGFIGFYLKTTVEGLVTSINLDGPANTSTQMRGSPSVNIIADGQWHLYEWSLDAPIWGSVPAIVAHTTGTLAHETWTIDSIYIRHPSGTAPSPSGTIYLDFVALNRTGSVAELIPEPSTYAAIFGGLALLGAFVYRRRMSAKK